MNAVTTSLSEVSVESVASRDRNGRAGERGFALVVAILALMLLTFLGLTLAATTSTELQIATNHRWSQQAYYNAEAGLELGKRVLMTANWPAILWPARTTSPLPAPDLAALPRRNDRWGNPGRNLDPVCDPALDPAQAGYGVVLDDGNAAGPYQNVNMWPDANTAGPCNLGDPGCVLLNGSFTLWVRYRLEPDPTAGGALVEDPDVIILTSEGTAPYANVTNLAAAQTFISANRAVKVIEVALERFTPSRCGKDQSQAGSDAAGSGMVGCTESPDTLRITGGTPPPGGIAGTGDAYNDRR